MKSALAFATVLLVALAALAGEPASATTPTTTATTTSPPQDSPMVAAAKRSNRKGRKPANVITNETLNKSGAGAHVTTTKQQRPFTTPKAYEPPKPTPEMIANQTRDAEKRRNEAAAKKAVEAKAKATAPTEGAEEEGLFYEEDTPPTEAGRTNPEATQKPPQR